ncbi:uncharacterized protein LOC123535412 [Mercenaria mercenaria]|uniref:uncharacterized protein LOC123535412 n=1 Tax=Mercenaria mercenaria TaxID=6596 RepID=UPI001E1D3B2F|nr:uncharacterized protein LOC123535412 [Mercenaria mercenaria]
MIGLLCFIVYSCICAAYGETDCSTLPNGHYNIGCKVFDVCTNHVLTTVECVPGKVYNNVTRRCDDERVVAPPCGRVRDCSTRADGSYPDLLLNCTSYFTCSHHIYFGHNFCTPGTVFEKTLGTCVWPDDAYRPCGNKV